MKKIQKNPLDSLLRGNDENKAEEGEKKENDGKRPG